MDIVETLRQLRTHHAATCTCFNQLGAVDGWKAGMGAMVDNKANDLVAIFMGLEDEIMHRGERLPRRPRDLPDYDFRAPEPRTEVGAALEKHAVRRRTHRRVPLPADTVAALQAFLAERLELLAAAAPFIKHRSRARSMAAREAKRVQKLLAILAARAAPDGSLHPIVK